MRFVLVACWLAVWLAPSRRQRVSPRCSSELYASKLYASKLYAERSGRLVSWRAGDRSMRGFSKTRNELWYGRRVSRVFVNFCVALCVYCRACCQ